MAGFIEDGYEREAYLAPDTPESGVEKLHDGITFSYRTASRNEVIKHDAQCRIALNNEDRDAACSVAAEKLACAFMASRITKWDLVDSKGETVPITVDNMARVIPALFSPMYRIVRGTRGSDKKPSETEESPSDEDLAKN